MVVQAIDAHLAQLELIDWINHLLEVEVVPALQVFIKVELC